MRKPSYTTAYKEESMLFYIALALLVVVLSSYMYFLSASVVHVVMRKEVDQQIAGVATAVSQLEATYIDMQHMVSNDIATQHGFFAVDEKIFIDQSADTLVLSSN